MDLARGLVMGSGSQVTEVAWKFHQVLSESQGAREPSVARRLDTKPEKLWVGAVLESQAQEPGAPVLGTKEDGHPAQESRCALPTSLSSWSPRTIRKCHPRWTGPGPPSLLTHRLISLETPDRRATESVSGYLGINLARPSCHMKLPVALLEGPPLILSKAREDKRPLSSSCSCRVDWQLPPSCPLGHPTSSHVPQLSPPLGPRHAQ